MTAYLKRNWMLLAAAAAALVVCLYGGGCVSDQGRGVRDQVPGQPTVAYEGELDPNKFNKWKEVKGTRRLITVGLGALTIKNPDPNGEVQLVRAYMLILKDGTDILTAYKYFKAGLPWFYKLDFEKNRYVNDPYTKEDVRACMECHCDQIKGCKNKGIEA